MFVVTMRFAAGLAIGGALGWWLKTQRMSTDRQDARPLPAADDHHTTTDPRRPERPARQRFSDYRPDVDGRVESAALIDGAVEDTFPASDPPAFMQSLVVGPPPREEGAAIERRQKDKRAGEDAFAE